MDMEQIPKLEVVDVSKEQISAVMRALRARVKSQQCRRTREQCQIAAYTRWNKKKSNGEKFTANAHRS